MHRGARPSFVLGTQPEVGERLDDQRIHRQFSAKAERAKVLELLSVGRPGPRSTSPTGHAPWCRTDRRVHAVRVSRPAVFHSSCRKQGRWLSQATTSRSVGLCRASTLASPGSVGREVPNAHSFPRGKSLRSASGSSCAGARTRIESAEQQHRLRSDQHPGRCRAEQRSSQVAAAGGGRRTCGRGTGVARAAQARL
jgi:hypothetical protein